LTHIHPHARPANCPDYTLAFPKPPASGANIQFSRKKIGAMLVDSGPIRCGGAMLNIVASSSNPVGEGIPLKTIVDASADVLRELGRPLHAREIAQAILTAGSARLSGLTPWKTVTSRLSTDIRKFGEVSQFQRAGHARFALREWGGSAEFLVNRRRMNPIEETIKVVPELEFRKLISEKQNDRLFKLDIEALIGVSIPMRRALAEDTAEFVQLIPTFVIRSGSKILTYRRTKRLPEARLHDVRCVSFGGHMQVDDDLDLFARSYLDPKSAMFRELYEELSFSRSVNPVYQGVLYLENSFFERQHVGIVFDVQVEDSVRVDSLETTRHIDVKYVDIHELLSESSDFDSWSSLILIEFYTRLFRK
jgi:predicted NUDIX family phosphoesterase